MKTYWKKNMKSTRPWSPHLQIYKPPFTMSMSLFHRITGCALAAMYTSFGLSCFITTGDFEGWVEWVRNLGIPSPIFFACKFLIVLPFAFHILNGIRHMTWDSLYGLTVSASNKNSMIILALAFAIAFTIALQKPSL
ncbi:hypothetical protein Ciccas_012051 [Cichlidogyrus casuarinus]|uniref:Succinate dehydrogenase cytochrome b560 subunit, mitochondrial n=1 Tax=Cichlidogyrus casuarinus TaxID=1844966 RepID=A0ABD2PPJ3_9PLAT